MFWSWFHVMYVQKSSEQSAGGYTSYFPIRRPTLQKELRQWTTRIRSFIQPNNRSVTNDFDDQKYCTFNVSLHFLRTPFSWTPTYVYELTHTTKMSKSNRILSGFLNFARLLPLFIQKTTRSEYARRGKECIYPSNDWLKNVANILWGDSFVNARP
jgi:hypothetical protein